MKKKWLLVVLVCAALAFAGYRYLFHGHRDIASEDAAFTVTAGKLQEDFTADSKLANEKYSDKTLDVSGVLTGYDAGSHTLSIDSAISATLADSTVASVPGGRVRIKGRLVGYDDLLGEIKMDQATIIK